MLILVSCTAKKEKATETRPTIPPNYSIEFKQFNGEENGYILTNISSEKRIEFPSYPIFSEDLKRFFVTYYHHEDQPDTITIFNLKNGEFEEEFSNTTKGWIGMDFTDIYPEYSVINTKWENNSKISFQKSFLNKKNYSSKMRSNKRFYYNFTKEKGWQLEKK